MIQPRSTLISADNTGTKKLRVHLVHGGSKRKFGSVADVVSASVIDAQPDVPLAPGTKVKAVIVRTRQPLRRSDGSRIRFDDNAAVILEAVAGSKNPMGSRVFGPVAREVKDAGYTKIASLAEEVL